MSGHVAFQNGTLAIYINHEDLTQLIKSGAIVVKLDCEGKVIANCLFLVTATEFSRAFLEMARDAEAEVFYQAKLARPKGRPGRKKGGHNRPKVTDGQAS